MSGPPTEATSHARVSWRWLLLPLLVLATAVTFLPALGNGFVWDDEPLLVMNPAYRGLGWAELRWMFTTTHLGPYMPLAWMSYGLDWLLWGMAPAGYHLTSLVLHIVNVLLFYLVLLRLLAAVRPPAPAGGNAPTHTFGALVAALLFGLHPLRVESVVWVTERRDVLSGLFYLLAVWLWLEHARARREGSTGPRGFYGGALGCFLLALLSKSMAVTLPAILLLLDVYPLRRHRTEGWGRLVAEKIPFLALAALTSAVAFWALARGGAMTPLAQIGVTGRLAISAYSLAFYVAKSLAPVSLSPLYELRLPVDPFAPEFLASGAVVGLATVVAWALRRRYPGCTAAWVAYVLMVSPVVGILHNGHQIAADRYTYLPSLPLAALVGGALAVIGGWTRRPAPRLAGAALLGLAILALGAATWRQAGLWRDGESLWRHAVGVDPASGLARGNLGAALLAQGRAPEAAVHFRRATELLPGSAKASFFLGLALARQGESGAALAHFRRALELQPNYADAHSGVGVVLAQEGRLTEALEHFARAVSLSPRSPEFRNNLGRALAEQGRLTEAEAEFREALRLRPEWSEARQNLEHARRVQGPADGAPGPAARPAR